jgi:hypothetical protein
VYTAGDRCTLAGDRCTLAGDRCTLAGDRCTLAGDRCIGFSLALHLQFGWKCSTEEIAPFT